MEDKRWEVGNMVQTVVEGLAFCAEKTQDEMIHDLLTLTLARLKVDWVGSRVENSEQNEELALKEIRKIIQILVDHGWVTESEEDSFIGKFFEEHVTKKGVYGIFGHEKGMGLVFSTEITEELMEILGIKTTERRQQFAWIAPYFTAVHRVICTKDSRRIEVLLPSK